jgi:ATP-dependent RNA helicase DDX3X
MNGGVDVLVATPGRLYDMYDRGRLSLRNVMVLIMDEADRMLDMGFEPQIRQIVEECDMPQKGVGKRQTLMYSATFPLVIQKLAQDFLDKYVFLAVGRVGSTTDFIRQEVEYVPDWAKAGKLLEILPQFEGEKTLVFTQTKKGADELERFLTNHNHHVMVIHGDKNQRDRERALTQFRRGYCSILIATDVAARGLDIPNVKTVIQHDCPSHIDDYVHRIGRTGRCGNTGYALTFVNENSRPILIDLINIIRESNQDVPQWYINMCGVVLQEKNKKRNKFGARDIRRHNNNNNRNNRYDNNQRKRGGRRHDNNNSRNNGGYQNNKFGGRGNYNNRNGDHNYHNVRQYGNKGHQNQGAGYQQHMQNYQPAYNYPQAGFVGYPAMGATVAMDATGNRYGAQNLNYLPNHKSNTGATQNFSAPGSNAAGSQDYVPGMNSASHDSKNFMAAISSSSSAALYQVPADF